MNRRMLRGTPIEKIDEIEKRLLALEDAVNPPAAPEDDAPKKKKTKKVK